MSTADICDHCRKWAAKTWPQHRTRMRNIEAHPNVKPHPCPRCGGIYWAVAEPDHQEGEETTDIMLKVAIVLVSLTIVSIIVFLMLMAKAEAQTFRDASGRLVGTVSRDANGTSTFRDGAGHMVGTSTRNANGTTTFRDGSGRMTGTREKR